MGVTRQINEHIVVVIMALSYSPRRNESHKRFNVYCIFMQCFKWPVVCV